MEKKTKKIILGAIITIILSYFLLNQINIKDIKILIDNISINYIILGLGLYTFSNILRALRLKLMLKEITVKRLIPIVFLHNMFNQLLPAKIGEISFLYLTKKEKNSKLEDNLSSLVIVRIFDFIIMLLMFLTSIFLLKDLPSIFYNLFWIVLVILLVSVTSIFILKKLDDLFPNVLIRLLNKLMPNKHKEKASIFLKSFLFSLKNTINRKNFIQVLTITITIWIMAYMAVYSILLSIGIDIGLAKVIIGSTFLVITTLLPIQGLAGLGSAEGFWTLGYVLLGVSKDIAIISGFTVHLTQIIYFLILGAIGYLLRRFI